MVMWIGLNVVHKIEARHYLENPIHDIRIDVLSFKRSLNTLTFLTTSSLKMNKRIQILSKKRLWI